MLFIKIILEFIRY